MMLMTCLEYFLAYGGVPLVVLAGLFFAVRRCRRVCQGYRWPGRTAFVVAGVYFAALVLPTVIYGADGSMLSSYLMLPLFPYMEILMYLGYATFLLVGSGICAAMWGMLAYLLSALIIVIWRRLTKSAQVAS